MADVVASPILTSSQNNSDLCGGNSDYGNLSHANGNYEMDVVQPQSVKQEPELNSFEAALAAAAAGANCRRNENAPPVKKEVYSDDDDIPWAERMAKEKKQKSLEKKKEKKRKGSDSEDEYRPEKKKKKEKEGKEKSSKKTPKKEVKKEEGEIPQKRRKKQEEVEDVWEWWKEEKKPAGIKWNSLHHKGPLFAPAYERLPDDVKFKYDGKVVSLSDEAEEVATFYAKMLNHDYTTKDAFNKNFFHDWRKVMTPAERELITDLKKCDFREMTVHFEKLSEIRKAMSKEEKAKIKEAKEAEAKIYGFAFIDGHKQKIGNFRIEPPGLFRGRGGHPKMGMLKKRVRPEDVIINCSKDSEIPVPPAGHKWKEVRHDNTVTWLVSWTENVLGQNKYIMLNPSSKIKGEKDYEKYETARRLKSRIDDIRAVYTADWKSKEMRVRQRAVALYFIDKLALRAGNEKDVDEAADTVGCCSLRCEHIKLYEKLDDKEYVVEFDFLGKDSIRYFNQVPVEKRVFKNLQLFMDNKDPGDDLFDRLDTASLNEHLRSLMDGLTVKVFRTYNASITLQQQLAKLTNADDNVHQKMLSYNRANRMVAILCNHQRAVPKGHEKAMENLEQKIKDKKRELKEAKAELEKARGTAKEKMQKKVTRLKEQLKKLKISRTDRDENKQIALSTSKLNYLDPRITVAWCKKFDVPVEKVFNRTLREKFRWAIDMTMSSDEEFIF
ncbi:DNA topoisomerase 1 [Parelaphostrongylus tenuis]|uniref:DNA topoisomerase I n=1 Tax=Parelaphostrongylus tenuis TaxID=148309 RepID=A0AAD5QSF5_PARTN|nr:DNA topoisomerase 1 [Parelaphostrongylus tenuis]